MKIFLLIPAFLFLFAFCDDDPGMEDAAVLLTIENGTDEPVYAFVDLNKKQLTPKDYSGLTVYGDDVRLLDGGESTQFDFTQGDFLYRPYATVMFFKESTVKRFSKDEIIAGDVYDLCINLTYSDLSLYGFRVVYHGESHWQEQQNEALR